MKRYLKLIPALAVLLFLFDAGELFAQPDSTAFIKYNLHSTRTMSLGEANLADGYDYSEMSLNPALLLFTQHQPDLYLTSFQSWNTNLGVQYLGAPVVTADRYAAAAGFLFHHKGVGSLNYLGKARHPLPDYDFYQFSAGYAIRLGKSVGLGSTSYLSLSNHSGKQYWNYSADFGLAYKPTKSIGYGIAFRGLGTGTRYRIGPGGEYILSNRLLPQSLEIGGTMDFPNQMDNKLLSLSLSNEKVFGRDGVWYRGGLEILPVPYLTVRGGYIYSQHHHGPRFGTGIKTSSFRIDYGVSYNKALDDRAHQLSVSVKF